MPTENPMSLPPLTDPSGPPLPSPLPSATGADTLAEASTEALLRALESFHPGTASHSEAVVDLATRVARAMSLPPERLERVRLTALLHDIGKLNVPAEILDKPGPLTDSELALVQRHAVLGGRLVMAMPGLWHLSRLIRACHERWDGEGYPDGLREEAIPLPSRIVFVCDAYDAMTSDRSYREALPQGVALHEIVAQSGTQFCPASAEALIEVVSGPFRLLGARMGR